MSETANKDNERYYVRALPEAGYDSWKELGSLEEAKKYAVQNSVYGSCVADAEGNIIFARHGRAAADLLYEAKCICDYTRDHQFTYGHAPMNPAVNHDAKIASCDRLVGWMLYRLGFTDQPHVHGLCVSGPQFTNWCIEHHFIKIERIDDLQPADIVFTRESPMGNPLHIFLHAGKSDTEGLFYRYDGGKIERLRSTQPSCEAIDDFMYAYRIPALALPGLSFKYGGVPFTLLRKKKETTAEGIRYLLPDGVLLDCKIEKFAKYGVTRWVNHWYNPGSGSSAQITELCDCDIITYFDPDPPVTRRNRQLTWEPETLQVFEAKAPHASDDDFNPVPTRIWAGDTRNITAGERAPFFDINRKEKGIIVAVGWTGVWNASFQRTERECRIKTGIKNTDFYIKPGEKFRTSSVTILEYNDGQVKGHNVWRRYIKEVISPIGKGERPAECPFSAIFWGGVTSESLINRWKGIIRAELPFDYCWIDAGWYEPLTADTADGQRLEWLNIGMWKVNQKYHPDGYKDVIEYLAQNNKKMLVWMEPERIRSTVPPWTKYLRHPNPDSPNRLIALNDDAVAEDVIELVSGVIQDLSLACYRQDFNMYAPEVWEYNDEDGRRGIVEIKYINNLYYFWDSLLARFPHLLIDNCAGGGNRIDIEMLSRSVSLWRSDYYVRWDACPEVFQMHSLGYASWLPYSGVGYGPTLGDLYSFRSAYASAITVRTWEHADPEWEVGASGEPLDWAKKYFDEFVSVRKYFSCDFYPLISNPHDSLSWAAAQYDCPEEESGIILAFRRAKSPFDNAVVELGGVSPDSVYVFFNADTDEITTVTGASLAENGLRLHIPNKRQSLLLRYKIVKND